METFQDVTAWFSDPVNWSGPQGIPQRLMEHLQYSWVAVLLAAPVGVALGTYIGHARRFEFITVTTANLGRALPSFAILALAFPIALHYNLGFSIWPTVAALFFLAVPPILTNTYVGVKEVDADTVESARGMGMSGSQVLRRIEVPLAAPLIVTGIRTAAVQVVATATLAAVVAGGGLGRFIVDGFARQRGDMILGGAFLVAALAILTEVFFAFVERSVKPRTASQDRSRFKPPYRHAAQAGRPGGDGYVPGA
ncbi:MAG: ABC transporter permease subunit [Actinobacteria bacterium]|nr:ABC transporter permease subunit [Actinomycetota bacterium]